MIVTGSPIQPPDTHTHTHAVLLDGPVTLLLCDLCSGFLLSQYRVVSQLELQHRHKQRVWNKG
jgi:hypothetical protein